MMSGIRRSLGGLSLDHSQTISTILAEVVDDEGEDANTTPRTKESTKFLLPMYRILLTKESIKFLLPI